MAGPTLTEVIKFICNAFTILPGEFGIVYKAHLLPQVTSKMSPCPLPQTVAVKTLKGRHHK